MDYFKKLRAAERELLKFPSYYIEGYSDFTYFDGSSLKDFIELLICKLFPRHKTISSANGICVCTPQKRRTIGDVYEVCRYYFDDVTLEEVQFTLYQLTKEKKIDYFFCNQIKKRVYMSMEVYKQHTVNPYKYKEADEYGITTQELEQALAEGY